jgi:uncharacterized protein (TIGR03032 family)
MSTFDDDFLIVSDPSDFTPGGLYAYDGGSVEVIDRIGTTGLALAPGGRLLRVLQTDDDPKSSGELLVYDSRGVRSYQRLDRVANGHGIVWHDGRFVVASTATNTIVWLDEAGRETARWRPDGNGDAWHFNDLCSHAGRIYVSAFGKFREHRDWDDNTADAGIVLGIPDANPFLKGLSAPHTPRVIDGRWVVCNSGTRELLIFETSGNAVERRIPLRTWPRGIAVQGRVVFVGESETRTENPDPTARATIAVIDADEWRVIDRIEVPGREIYDLVFVPGSLANGITTGFRTNNHRGRASGQLDMFQEVGVEPTRLWAIADPLAVGDRRVRIEAQISDRMPEFADVDVDLVLENLGSAILVTALPNPVYLSYRWYPNDEPSHIVEGPLMTSLPRAVPPRTPTHCSMRIRTHKAGRYRLRLTLAQEYVGWFDDVDAGSIFEAVVEVVAAPTFDEIDTDSTFEPTVEAISVAVST